MIQKTTSEIMYENSSKTSQRVWNHCVLLKKSEIVSVG